MTDNINRVPAPTSACRAHALLLAVLAACQTVKGAGAELGGTIAEYTACPLSVIDCGHVFECAAAADTPSGRIEICIDDDDRPEQLDNIELLFGQCEPTDRHQGLCRYCCGADCPRGCNAYSGCFCPASEVL